MIKLLIIFLLLIVGCGGERDSFTSGFRCSDLPENLRATDCVTK